MTKLIEFFHLVLANTKTPNLYQVLGINTYMQNLKKSVELISFTKLNQRHRCREQTYGYQGGRGSGMNGKTGIDIYRDIIDTMYKIEN